MVGHQRQLQLESIFQYEWCAIPSSLVDGYGCLCKGNKSVLARRLGGLQQSAAAPDCIIVDAQQLLYHITWTRGGDASAFVESIKRHLSLCPSDSQKSLVFDKYHDLSAKDHERMRCGGKGTTDYNLTINSPLPNRDACHYEEQA